MKKILDLIDRVENFTLVWTILALAIIGFVQVIARYVFNISFTWYEELGRYLGVFIAFLGGAIGVKTGSHFTMDLIVTHLGKRWQNIVSTLTAGMSCTFFLLVAWYSWKIVLRMYGYGTTSPTMQIPMYIAYLPIPVFSMVMGFRHIIKALGYLLKAFETFEEKGNAL
ncbi:MAG: TRAP transporter small permease [Desulfobacteraceae bacterium]|nr:TRAP transporter small permease [Desulfobacteraceae bacterium]